VSSDLPAHLARRVSFGLIGLALVASAALASTPAQATAATTVAVRAGDAAASVECLTSTSRPTKWRAGADTSDVSSAVSREVAAVVAAATPVAATSSTGAASAERGVVAALPSHIRVPVMIHVIHGRRHGERRISKRGARRMFATLRAGYAGAQDPTMAPTGVTFVLRKITKNTNESWFHAAPFSRADRQMKRRLHRGKANMLNIYVNRPMSRGQLLLGFSIFPWQRRANPTLDGVTISDVGLPGGRAVGYNLGDTVIHETGHWLGLLHTFEGGCADPGDGVADTPAEAVPSFRCDDVNTCDTPVFPDPANPAGPPIDLPDPIHNFMNYSYDACMYQFTPGQNARMIALFVHYRSRR
jgi:hypothetical protein